MTWLRSSTDRSNRSELVTPLPSLGMRKKSSATLRSAPSMKWRGMIIALVRVRGKLRGKVRLRSKLRVRVRGKLKVKVKLRGKVRGKLTVRGKVRVGIGARVRGKGPGGG